MTDLKFKIGDRVYIRSKRLLYYSTLSTKGTYRGVCLEVAKFEGLSLHQQPDGSNLKPLWASVHRIGAPEDLTLCSIVDLLSEEEYAAQQTLQALDSEWGSE